MIGMVTLMFILQASSASAAGLDDEDESTAIRKAQAALPTSLQMVDDAITLLSKGLAGMTQEERELFQGFFDPGNTGDIDENYVLQVLDNYRRLREVLNKELTIKYEPESRDCRLMALFHTNYFEVHVCSYILEETNAGRIARDLVHEAAHIAWLANDREYYYSQDYQPYQKLTPRGHPAAQIPVVGRIIREIVLDDTLFNPDTYCTFAARLTEDVE